MKRTVYFYKTTKTYYAIEVESGSATAIKDAKVILNTCSDPAKYVVKGLENDDGYIWAGTGDIHR